jgi:urate oxidase
MGFQSGKDKLSTSRHSFMKTKLIHQRYGKERVRFMRVVRAETDHRVMDVKAGISLEGEFSDAYYSDSNHQVIATDTMKNTLIVLAHDDPSKALESYGLRVVEHFLTAYDHITKVSLHLEQKLWKRMTVQGKPHPFTFEGSNLRPTVRIEATRDTLKLWSGVECWELMKTTESGFIGYPRDAFTTLPETRDRILATEASVEWLFQKIEGVDFASVQDRILGAAAEVFAGQYSPSVQRTLFQMGEAALQTAPEIRSIRLTMPNKHYLPLNLSAFGRPEKQDNCYLPTDEPHGQIEAEVGRD